MFKIHIIVAVRSLWKHKGYSAINVVGLACAMASAIFLCAYLTEELRYVNYHENGHRIFRVLKEVRRDVGTKYSDWVPGGTTVAVREQFPEVKAARATASQHTRSWLRVDDRTLSDFMCRVDPELLEVFGFQLTRGHLSRDAMTAVITEELARKFFGEADPIGQTITVVEGLADYTITGILQDIPVYAYIRLGLVTAAPPPDNVTWDGWRSDLKNYLLLPEGMRPERIEAALNQSLARAMPAEDAAKMTLRLQPMDEAHLYQYGGPGQGTIQDLGFFGMITLIIAAVACANFVNMAVARTMARASEIATRKAIGAGWLSIVGQFVTEAVLIAAAATVLGAIVVSLDPVVSVLGWHAVNVDYLTDWHFATGVVLLLFVVAVAAGLYPGIVALRIPMRNITGVTRRSVAGLRTRDVLIVGQLTCAVFFIASTIVVREQTSRMVSADLGFDSDRVLTTRFVFNDSLLWSRREVIKEAFRRTPGVAAASTQWPGPGMETQVATVFGETDPANGFEVQLLGVDPDFLDTFGIELVAGRNVRPGESRRSDLMLNETAVRRLGWDQAGMTGAVGRTLRVAGETGTVVGVVRDFHYSSLRDRIPPLLLRTRPQLALAVRLDGRDLEKTLAAVEVTWREHFEQPNQLRFVTDMWGFSIENERFRDQAYELLSWIAILLAGLGVYGLASYETEQRRREVGMRKALGATAASIVALFWKGHVRLLVVATAIAVPLSYRLAGEWLQGFAYRIDLTAAPFAFAVAAAALLFLSLVGVQAARIGRVPPAETLRSE